MSSSSLSGPAPFSEHICPLFFPFSTLLIYFRKSFKKRGQGAYIISCDHTGRVTADQLELHAEPPESVSLFCLKPTTWWKKLENLANKWKGMGEIKREKHALHTCFFVQGEVPDLPIFRRFEMVLGPHYIKTIFKRALWLTFCLGWRARGSHESCNAEKNGH